MSSIGPTTKHNQGFHLVVFKRDYGSTELVYSGKLSELIDKELIFTHSAMTGKWKYSKRLDTKICINTISIYMQPAERNSSSLLLIVLNKISSIR